MDCQLKECLWDLGFTPVNISVLADQLAFYPNKDDANYILQGFSTGFKLEYKGPRVPVFSKNLKSAIDKNCLLSKKLYDEFSLGRILGPFENPPISNLRINPVGLLPKQTGGFRLITHLSYPPGRSINDFIDPEYCHVQYSQFDNVVKIVQEIGMSAYMAKADISSAFNLCPIWPGDFDLLGIKTDEGYWIQKMLPQGASCSCFIFEKFAKFLQWLVSKESKSSYFDHMLDDFFMAEKSFGKCLSLMQTFNKVCSELGVPLSIEKWMGPVTTIIYLGLEIDSIKQIVRVPLEKITKAKKQP